MDADYLNEFEQMNETTESVFDLGEHELLIVLNDGTNLTSGMMLMILMMFYI